MRSILARLRAGASLTILLAACGGASQPAPASTGAGSSGGATSASSASSAKPASSVSAAASGASTAAKAAAAGDKMVVSHSQLASTPNAAGLAAGIFAKHGLDVDVRYIPQGATGMQVLLSGETQVAELGGAEMLAAAANGADLVIIANLEPVYPFKFMGSKEIATIADLKGKKVGITTAGSVDDIAIRASLPAMGLDPAKDVTMVPVGPENARVAALLNGQIQATDTTPKATLDVEAAGGHVLYDIASVNLPAATAGLVAQRAWVDGHREVVQRYIDAIVETIAFERKEKTFEQGVIKKVFSIDDPKVLDAVYDYYVLHSMAAIPLPKAEQFKATQDAVAAQNAKAKDLDLSRLLDPTFVLSAVDRGLDKS